MKKLLLLTGTALAGLLISSCAQQVAAQTAQKPINLHDLYKREQEEEIVNLLRTPPTPVKTPDTILRVLILPHVNKQGILVTSHYAFVDAQQGRWIMGNYLLQEGKALKEINPLAPISNQEKKTK